MEDSYQKGISEKLILSVEFEKLFFDYFKHLSTLSSASIPIIGAVLINRIQHPCCLILAFSSTLFFLSCIVISIRSLPLAANQVPIKGKLIVAALDHNAEELKALWDNYENLAKKLNSLGTTVQILFFLGILNFSLFLASFLIS
jgi:hypothetical protein